MYLKQALTVPARLCIRTGFPLQEKVILPACIKNTERSFHQWAAVRSCLHGMKEGAVHPADEKNVPVFEGRFNIGVVSLHLPMILAKSRQEGRDFYEVLDYYLELIRKIHIRTYAYLGEMKASTNPLAYCEGGFYGVI